MAGYGYRQYDSLVSCVKPLTFTYPPGWLILGIMTATMAFLMSLFPAQMARNSLRNRSLTTDTGPALLSLNSFAVQINSAELKVSNPIPLVHSELGILI